MLAKSFVALAMGVALVAPAAQVPARNGSADSTTGVSADTLKGRVGEPIRMLGRIELIVTKEQPPSDVIIPAPFFKAPMNDAEARLPQFVTLAFATPSQTPITFVVSSDPSKSDLVLRVVDGYVVSPYYIIHAGTEHKASQAMVGPGLFAYRATLKGKDYLLLLFYLRFRSFLPDKDLALTLQVDGKRQNVLVSVDRRAI